MSDSYELPNGWEWTKLGKIVTIKNGKHYKDVLNPNGQYPIYGSGGIIDYADDYLCNENSVVIGQSGTINKPIFIRKRFWNTSAAFGIEANGDYLVSLFLFYFTQQFDFLKLKTGVAIPHLRKSDLYRIKIPIPSLPEQQRIVSKLDKLFEKIDKAIALHQQNIDEADVFMGSVLNDVFGALEKKSEWCKIDDIYNLRTGGTPSTKNREYWDNGTIKWLSSSDINQIQIYDCKGRITQLGFNNSNTGIIEKDSVLIALNGQGKTRGSVAMLRTEAALNQSLIAISPKDRKKTTPDFLFRNLQMRYLEIRELTGLNDRRGLNMSLVRNIKVPIPSLPIQQKVVTHLDNLSERIEKVKSTQKEKMNSLKALKASILDKAFRGELV